MFISGRKVGVAVSGGADSVFLLHALVELAPRFGIRLAVVHLNHRLRGAESDADAAFVRGLAGQLALPFHYRETDVAAADDNLEQAGRRARLEFFRSLIEAGEVDRIATGHTRDDQAETVLFRFLRGCGMAGLAGILPATAEGLVRPLLDVDRAEIEEWLRGRGLGWREDASNRDPAFARNRIRHDLLPSLSQAWNPNLAGTLAGAAAVARDEEDYWRGKINDLFGSLATRDGEAVILPVRWVLELPAAVRRRLIRKAFGEARGDLRGIEFRHVEAVLALLDGDGHGRVQIPGLDVFRSFEWVRIATPADPRPRNWSLDIPSPGRYQLPGLRSYICMELRNTEPPGEPQGYNSKVSDLDWERIAGGLRVRNWRPGDAYCPVGATSPKKVKLLFQEHRIPLWERRDWPMVTFEETIVWSRLFGPAEGFQAGGSTRTVLRITEDFRHAQESGDASGASHR